LARTGLIFTRIQEGAQPGGLTQPQPGQTEPGIPYHVPSCWQGRPRGAFVASGSQTRTFFGAQAWGGDNGRAEQCVLKQLS